MDQKLIEELWKLQIDPSREASSILVETNISADEGQWIQLEILGRWLNEGEELGGWKIGMTSGDSRDALGKGKAFWLRLKKQAVSKRSAHTALNAS